MTPDELPSRRLPAPSPGASGSRVRRPRGTRRSVKVAERIARSLITVGGLGTIVAVTTIFAFLLWVIVPLFQDPEVGEARLAQGGAAPARVLATGTDEHGMLCWTVTAQGWLEVTVPGQAGTLVDQPLLPGAAVTAVCLGADGASGAVALADGSVRTLALGYRSEVIARRDAPVEAWRSLPAGVLSLHEGRVAQGLPRGELRVKSLEVRLGEPFPAGDAPVVRVARTELPGGSLLVTVDGQGRARVHRLEEKRNMLDRRKPVRIERTTVDLPLEGVAPEGLPAALAVAGAGDNVMLAWPDGRCLRYDLRDLERVQMVESVDLVPAPGERLVALGWMLGRTTLVVGDSRGRVAGWFRTKPYAASTPDGALLQQVHLLEDGAAPVTALSSGQRNRLVVAGDAAGVVRVWQMTTGRLLARLDAPGPVDAVALAPKEDAIVVRSGATMLQWAFHARHPESGLAALFGKVWYEGYEKPEHVWQSTGGTDDFEPKLGLVPLVFGTLKATAYSMLFAVPIALLAAIFTSEFLGARLRTSVKSVIEIMASLPSVVLGFLAAIVVAPFVQDVVPTVLASFVVVPAVLLLAAHLWQMLPQHVGLRLAGLPRVLAMVAVFPLGLALSAWVAPGMERALFRGDLLGWLNHEVVVDDLAQAGVARGEPPGPEGRAALAALVAGADLPAAQRQGLLATAGMEAGGKRPAEGEAALLRGDEVERVRATHQASAWGGWAFLGFPLCVLLVLLVLDRLVSPRLRQASRGWTRGKAGWVALARLVCGGLAALVLAVVLGHALASLGADPRGDFSYASRGEGALMGSPVQRNALVVGFLMGFAIIPIIYTLAEDALSSVPQHLRLASLGAGATPWQTATRVILPTAASGLFSAVMIGLGRAVGETMIVLMAAGNTSVLDWNMFNGFRTLSANIATEMPEAVVGSTHYRVLFLAAFTLFILTFLLNTLAEAVRQRFRKRAFQL